LVRAAVRPDSSVCWGRDPDPDDLLLSAHPLTVVFQKKKTPQRHDRAPPSHSVREPAGRHLHRARAWPPSSSLSITPPARHGRPLPLHCASHLPRSSSAYGPPSSPRMTRCSLYQSDKLYTGKLYAPMSLHSPQHQGDVAQNIHVASVCFKYFRGTL
jgi:hypothetical protein